MPPKAKTASIFLPKKRAQPDSEVETNDEKQICLGDITAKFTRAQLNEADKEELIDHVLALQKHMSESTMGMKKSVMAPSMSPEQIKENVKVVRRM